MFVALEPCSSPDFSSLDPLKLGCPRHDAPIRAHHSKLGAAAVSHAGGGHPAASDRAATARAHRLRTHLTGPAALCRPPLRSPRGAAGCGVPRLGLLPNPQPRRAAAASHPPASALPRLLPAAVAPERAPCRLQGQQLLRLWRRQGSHLLPRRLDGGLRPGMDTRVAHPPACGASWAPPRPVPRFLVSNAVAVDIAVGYECPWIWL